MQNERETQEFNLSARTPRTSTTPRTAETYPDLFQFSDYRAFLSAFARDKKKANPRWSYGLWAKQLGLKNSTSILKILHGKRDAGREITSKLVEYFGFHEKERAYFENLVLLSKAGDDAALKVALMEQLKKAHPGREFSLLDEKRFAAVSNWWFYAIRQMTHLPDFTPDADWIASQLEFKVLPREISHALRTLREMGLLQFDESTGKALPVSLGLNTTDDIASEAIKRFHEEILELARASLRKIPVERRQISGLTLPVRTEDLPRIKEFLRKMEDQFIETFEAPEGDAVYQLELACFPLTRKNGKSKTKKQEREK